MVNKQMKSQRAPYLTGDAEPATIRRGNGSNINRDLKRMREWLKARGEPSAWKKRKGK
jgi:hypothetical protein